MQGIFISYRRQDSQSAAGRLADHLKEHMLGVPMFRDVETIEPGVDFVEAIGRALQSCDVLLAVIGPRWLDLVGPNGKRRLDNPNDYTRLEIVTALQRANVRVIPVLVEGAQMPDSDALPDDLKPLARRNAIELTDKRWEFDVSQLIETLNKVLDIHTPTPKPGPRPPAPPQPDGRNWFQRLSPVARWSLISVLFILGVASYVADQQDQAFNGSTVGPVMGPTMGQTSGPPMAPNPMPVTPNPAGMGGAAPAAGTGGTVNLTGLWLDSEGGRHQIVQNGNRLQVQGMSPEGYVAGAGVIQGRSGWIDYTLNGYPLRAQVEAAPDGMRLRIMVVDSTTGDQDVLTMQRVQ